jgi:multidrug efflux system membrane fusion protein
MPKISPSVIIAAVIMFAFLAYFGVRTMMANSETAEAAPIETTEPRAPKRPEVIVRTVTAQPHAIVASLKGRTAPDRVVTVRSETMGTVTSAPVREGRVVAQGTILCGLGLETRQARIAEAEATVAAAKLDYDSATTLEEKGWTSSNRAAATKAALDRAEASLEAAKVEMNKTKLRAPFSGVFEERIAEMGDFLSPGSPCGTIVDLNPIVVRLDATEGQVARMVVGKDATVTLNDGRVLDGKVRFVARTANVQTRTFAVEIAADNRDSSIAAGLTASVKVEMGDSPAVKLTPALLVLHEDGRVGVRHVDGDDIIQFAEVTIVDDAPDGIWVTGLPDGTRILAAGQDFVREGIRVETVPEQG